jgi:hypothetical protein
MAAETKAEVEVELTTNYVVASIDSYPITVDLIETTPSMFTISDSGEIQFPNTMNEFRNAINKLEFTVDKKLLNPESVLGLWDEISSKSVQLVNLFNGYKPFNCNGNGPFDESDEGNYYTEDIVLARFVLPDCDGFNSNIEFKECKEKSKSFSITFYGVNGGATYKYKIGLSQKIPLVSKAQELTLKVVMKKVRFENKFGDVLWFSEVKDVKRMINNRKVTREDFSSSKKKSLPSGDILGFEEVSNPSINEARQIQFIFENKADFLIGASIFDEPFTSGAEVSGRITFDESIILNYSVPPKSKYFLTTSERYLFHKWRKNSD